MGLSLSYPNPNPNPNWTEEEEWGSLSHPPLLEQAVDPALRGELVLDVALEAVFVPLGGVTPSPPEFLRGPDIAVGSAKRWCVMTSSLKGHSS